MLEQLLRLYPDADVYTLVDFLEPGERSFLQGRPVHTSFIQRLPLAKKHYRQYLPLMPLAIEQFDLSSYDMVLSSSSAVAKGVITGPDQLHVSYVHSPIRYAWDLQHQYLRESGLDRGLRGFAARALLHYIRQWDSRTANGVDAFVANSQFIARRIWKVYRRESAVVYPPVDVDRFPLCADKEDFYLTASRLVPYKRIDLIVEAFRSMPNRRLFVIGDGPDYGKVKRAAPANVTLLGYQPYEALKSYLQRARAFLFAAEEAFGIAPVEAQACGTAVIAFGKGGALETVRGVDQERATGVFFFEQTAAALRDAVMRFEESSDIISPTACRENALRFSPERFRKEISEFVTKALCR